MTVHARHSIVFHLITKNSLLCELMKVLYGGKVSDRLWVNLLTHVNPPITFKRASFEVGHLAKGKGP